MVRSLLVFADKLLLPSEGFIPAHYQGFRDLEIVYVSPHFGWRANDLTANKMPVSENALGRFAYRQFGWTPAIKGLRALNPIAIHAHFGRGGAAALPLASKLDVPLFVTFHGGDATKTTHTSRGVSPSIYQRRQRCLFDRASGFFAVSNFIADRLVAQGFPAEKVQTHYIGIDLAPMTPPAPREGPMLFVGRLVEKKGVSYLIDAMRHLGDTAPGLVIAGDGPLRTDLAKQAAGMNNIEFVGWQTPDEIQALMATCRAVVVPSCTAPSGDSEGLPTVALEAIRAGAPVIATDHSGLPEIIQDGVTGFVAKQHDADDLARTIRELLEADAGLLIAMGEAGQATLRGRFDASVQSRKLEQIFLSV